MLASVVIMTQLTGCMGSIETGNVGLRTNFNGTVDERVEQPGIYTAVLGHVDEYSLKDIAVNLENLQPKANDNLSLAELDVTVYYRAASAQAVRDLAIKRAGSSVQFSGVHYYATAYHFVESVSKSEVADAVSKHDSLTIHNERDKLAAEIKKSVQDSIDTSDPGSIQITRVVIRQVKTDPTIEQSIRNVVAKEKELEASKLQVAIAKSNAEATQQTGLTLTPAFLQHEYNQALMKFAEHGGTVILDGSSSNKMINVGK
jgi:regulator of protease activity HflC (stomatin/prohibitin superfamily)